MNHTITCKLFVFDRNTWYCKEQLHKKCKYERSGETVYLLGNKKEHVESISSYGFANIQAWYNLSYTVVSADVLQLQYDLLINIPFSLPQQSSPVVLYPSSSRVICHRDSNDTAPGTFRQDLSNHAKMPHLGQSHNVIIYKRAYVKYDSWSGGCEFDLPNRPFLSTWSHFTCQTYSSMLWAAACVISLVTKYKCIMNIKLHNVKFSHLKT